MHPTITYKLLIDYPSVNGVITQWIDIDITLDQRSKSKVKNRARAAARARELYPNCVIHQIVYT